MKLGRIPQCVVPRLLGIILAGFQATTHANVWAESEKLVSEQKLQAALDNVTAIKTQAAAKGDDLLWTEALIKSAQMQIGLHGYETAVRNLKSEKWPQNPSGRVMLNLYFGHSMMRYYGAYSWEIQKREKTISKHEVDLKAWTQEEIGREISKTFDLVMAEGPALDQPLPAAFAAYFQKNNYPENIRSTLRDAVVYLAVEHLANTQYWTPTESNESYKLDLRKLAHTPPTRRLPAADTEAHPIQKIASWLGEHRDFHRGHKRPEGALEAQYELYSRLNNIFTSAEDHAIIQSVLRQTQLQNSSYAWWARGQALLAQFIQNTNVPGRLIEARAEALKGLNSYSKSVGGQMCAAIVDQIELPSYSIMSMASDGAQTRSLLIQYKNLTKLYFRVYPVDFEKRVKEKRNNQDFFETDKALDFVRTNSEASIAEWSVDLPTTKDYALHRRFTVPTIKSPGAYLIVASTRPDFSGNNDIVQATRFIQTDLVLATVSEGRGEVETRVYSGSTGLPVKNASVTIYRFTWDKTPEALPAMQTDAQGIVKYREPPKASGTYWNYFLVARKAGQFALQTDGLHFGQEGGEPRSEATMIFTDRSVYRPQQKVFWKVAAYTGLTNRGTFQAAAKNTSVTVQLVDPNNQNVATRTVTVNAFGTASGEFDIPSGRPLGTWYVRSSSSLYGYADIRVEEYKRPTFLTELKEAIEPMRLNRKTIVRGSANYYFGLPVSAGVAKWRVTRAESYPWWYSYHRGYYGSSSSPQVVASGTSNIRADGTYDIEFTPEADERKAKSSPGVTFNFDVAADITDEGGETRSASRSYRLGFVAVEADLLWTPVYFRSDEAIDIKAQLRTLDGKPQAGSAKYRVVRLKSPASSVVPSELPRAQNQHEQIHTEADFEKYGHPDDNKRARWETQFNWEALAAVWPEGEQVTSGNLTHSHDGKSEIHLKPLDKGGVYQIQYETKDSFGAKYVMTRIFMVAAPQAQMAIPLYLQAQSAVVEVGNKAKFFLYSGLAKQHLTVDIYRGRRLLNRKNFVVGQDSPYFEIPVTMEDRGGFTVVAYGLKDHQHLRQEFNIQVPWTDRTLQMEWSTFRDQIRPGTKETVRVSVKDSKGRPLENGGAEVLAYMYDRSLDIFGHHNYPQPISLYPYRMGAPGPQLSLGTQSGWHVTGNFTSPRGSPSLHGDHLIFYDNYGIGGPGRRGHGRLGVAYKSSRSDMGTDDGFAEVASAQAMEAVAAGKVASAGPELRSNFSESAFFYPHLITGRDGSISFEFTVPDSVTTWNVLAHALTPDYRSGTVSKDTKSVKELMVRPYAPRFLREGDESEIQVAVNNASDKEISGQLTFEIENPDTNKSALAEFGLTPTTASKNFVVAAKGTTTLGFTLKAPSKVGMYAFKVMAKTKNYSDGERRPFPVLPSRMHLVQSRFVSLRDKDRKVLEFKDLAKNDDPTLLNEKMVVNIDAQLFYGVLQALPYLVEYPYACTEQTLNRFLSTGIVSSLFAQFPSVATMAKNMSSRKEQFERFDENDSNRKMTLEESPWLQESQGGAEKESDLLPILDSRVANAERDRSLTRLKKLQLPDGGFPWFEGGPADRYITLYTLLGLARGLEFQVDVPKEVIAKAWRFTRDWLDSELETMMGHNCCWEQITTINYAVGMYPDDSWTGGLFDEAYRKRLLDFSFKHWKSHSPLLKGYLALTLHRMKRTTDAKLVWDSVMDSAKSDEQLGVYWAPEDRSWLWYNDTIETHAFSLRTLMELYPNDKRNDALVQWLFLNRKLNHWKSTRATSEVVYSLAHFLKSNSTLAVKEVVNVDAGTQKTQFVFEPDRYTGRKNQIVIPANKIDPKTSSKILVEKSTPGFAFASATWHFSTEKLPEEDRGDFFNVSRKYFKRENNGKEWTLRPLQEGELLQVGDQLEVQLSLRTKHAAEYVHLRDPRAAGLEPENAISGYKWDLGLYWYQETRDSGANFFFAGLPVGEYTFKYRLRANMAGTFRIGPATVQSMYAPEFNAYSTGYKMKIGPAKK
jgi:uncharacterized protein YfaS (alpha-2-macroglobulin family)